MNNSMKKMLTLLFVMLLALALTTALVACGGDHDGNGNDNSVQSVTLNKTAITLTTGESETLVATVVPTSFASSAVWSSTEPTVASVDTVGKVTAIKHGTAVIKVTVDSMSASCTVTVLPSAENVVTARQATANSTEQNYDFYLNLKGQMQIGAFNGEANANYDGAYRFNKDTSALKFKRKTSGILLYDGTEYIFSEGDSRIKLVMNENDVLKRTSIVANDDELTLVNLPIVSLVNSLEEDNVTDIRLSTLAGYRYVTNIALTSSNQYLTKVLNMIAKQGTSVDMGDVTFTNPVNGIELHFNLGDNTLTDFTLSAQVKFPVNSVDVVLALTYSQSANNATISIPSTPGLIYGSASVNGELSVINNAISNVKNSNTYSLDVTAENAFDPGWNVLATKDSFTAKMYKNTNDSRADFNTSFKYKSHTEEDGKETYKYTVGNIQDGSVHMISRKGTNQQFALEDRTSLNGIFDGLLAPVTFTAANVDCIKKETNGSTVTYRLYLNDSSTIATIEKLILMLNSIPEDAAILVNNYINKTSYLIKESELVVTMTDGAISGISCETEMKYSPTGGTYTENKITLNNVIKVDFNKDLTKAAEYEAPKNVNTGLTGGLGLNNAKFYIL